MNCTVGNVFGEARIGKDIFNRSEIKTYIIAALIYAAITLAMFWPISTAVTNVVPRNGDVYNMLWNLWWVNYATFTLHTSIFSTKLLYYPIGANLVSEPMMPISAILGIPLQWISLALEYNVFFLTGFILSGLFAFMLVRYLVGNRYAAFIGGMVFAFSPMHVAQSYAHLNWTVIEWIPLFLLFFILVLKERKHVYIFGAAASFVLLTFMGDIQQAILTIVLVIFILCYISIKNKKIILDRQLMICAIEMIILILIIGAPLFVPIANSLLHSGAISEAGESSSLGNAVLWSNNLLSFFLPSVYNGLFSGIASKYYGSIYLGSQETISYLGYSVLALCIFAVLYYGNRRPKIRDNVRIWLWMVVFFAYFSIGPVLIVYNFLTPIPGIFILYHFIPLFNLIREPGRFDLLATLGLAVLSGFGIRALFEKMGSANRHAFRNFCITLVFAILILVEYNGIPLGPSISHLFANTQVPAAYYTINSINGNSVIMLPDSINFYNNYTPLVMYYQTVFKKPILGGYTSRQNLTEYYSVANVPLSKIGQDPEILNGMSYNSPTVKNYSKLTLQMLSEDNVSVVGVINGAYNSTSRKILLNYLTYLFGNSIYQSNSTTLFSTSNAFSNNTIMR